jgi:hypothetical protein
MRRRLAKIASALSGSASQDLADPVDAALDGAEIIMRGNSGGATRSGSLP